LDDFGVSETIGTAVGCEVRPFIGGVVPPETGAFFASFSKALNITPAKR
jgi:hypothetical protein